MSRRALAQLINDLARPLTGEPAMPACTAEIYFHDFDGSPESMPCARRATTRIVTRAGFVRAMVEAEGGWDAYRARALHDGDNDPGEDPGEEAWGDSVELLCDAHANDCRASADTDEAYGYTIEADEPLAEPEYDEAAAEAEDERRRSRSE